MVVAWSRRTVVHSLKNTVVAVLLLGVSYGVYNVLTTPDPALENEAGMIGPLNIDEGGGFVSSMNAPNPNATTANMNSAHTHHASESPGSGTSAANSMASGSGGFRATPPPANSMPAVASRNTAPSAMNMELPVIADTAIDSSISVPDGGAHFIPGVARRQPQFNFASDAGPQTASGELPLDTNNASPEDQVLIDAIKEELQPDRNMNIFTPSAKPDKSFVSAPESRDAQLTIELPEATTVEPEEGSNNEKPLSAMWHPVDKMIVDGNFRGALATLSRYYTDTTLTAIDQEKLMTWLDSLAGKVIYSPEHNLYRNSYTVRDGDTLQDLARRWNVTSQLIFNVNRPNIENPSELPAGAELKMITGPFHAELDPAGGVMTLFVKNLYAGRFNIRVSDAGNFQPGSFAIQEKSRDLGGNTWTITLDGGLCIKTVGENEPVPAGCIGLDPKDSSDVFGILTESSRVFVK